MFEKTAGNQSMKSIYEIEKWIEIELANHVFLLKANLS